MDNFGRMPHQIAIRVPPIQTTYSLNLLTLQMSMAYWRRNALNSSFNSRVFGLAIAIIKMKGGVPSKPKARDPNLALFY